MRPASPAQGRMSCKIGMSGKVGKAGEFGKAGKTKNSALPKRSWDLCGLSVTFFSDTILSFLSCTNVLLIEIE